MYSNAGGSVGTMYRGKSLGNNVTFTGSLVGIAAGQTINGYNISASNSFQLASNILMTSTGNGILALYNITQTDFTRLQFGGTTSSFPALARSASRLQSVLADNSAFAGFDAADIVASASPTTVTAGKVSYGGSTQTTVGAAGAASALPATPLGYIQINVAGTAAKIPYYNN